MNHRHSQLLASIAVAAAAAACSSEPANTLAGGSFDPVVGAQPTPAATAQPAPTSSVWTPPPLPVPTQGPASSGSPARKFYLEKVHAALGSCASCHASAPTDDVFKVAPANVMFDTAAQIQAMAPRILERAVKTSTMPFVNKTQMSDHERAELGAWIAAGARLE